MNIYLRSIAAITADVLYAAGDVMHRAGHLAAWPTDRAADRLKVLSMVGR